MFFDVECMALYVEYKSYTVGYKTFQDKDS